MANTEKLGTADNDTLEGGVGDDVIKGLGGDDTLRGFGGNDVLEGGDGYDNLYGGQGDDTLIAGNAGTHTDTRSNYLVGEEGNDTLMGSDYVGGNYAGSGDYLYGGNGNDSLSGRAGNDALSGDGGNDSLDGGAGDDRLEDSEGSNAVQGGEGNDEFQIYSGTATDISTLTGGAGVDRFILNPYNNSTLNVTDFSAGVAGDVIDISQLLSNSTGYASGNPFAADVGFLRLVQTNTDVQLQWDEDGLATSSTWKTVLTLQNLELTAAGFTGENFSPNVGLPNINNAPTAQNQAKGVATGTAYALKASDFGFSDVDTADSLQAIKITSFPTGNYFLSLNGAAVTLNQSISAADLNQGGLVFTPNTHGAQYDLSFQVSDGKAFSVSSYTFSIYAGVNGFIEKNGTVNDDLLEGTIGDDLIRGLAGDDTLNGFAGNDNLEGADGYDVLTGGEGNDNLTGGDGSDELFGDDSYYFEPDQESVGNDTLSGGNGNDYLYGGAGDDILNGDVGNDELVGGRGNDTFSGGEGDDQFYDYSGTNTMDGGAGNDQFTVSTQLETDVSTLTGGTGADTFNLIAWNPGGVIVTDFSAGVGGDIININELLFESIGYVSGNPFSNQAGYLRLLQSGADTHLQWDADGLAGSNDWQTVLTLQNIDLSKTPLTVDNFAPAAAPDGSSAGVNRVGDNNANILEGGVSDDILKGLGGDDILRGYAGNDLLEGGLGADDLYGGQGDDTLIAGTPDTLEDTGNNGLYGDDGKDTLIGSNNVRDYLVGGNGDDHLSGGGGDDELYGDGDYYYGEETFGNDILLGGNGDDYIFGGNGVDTLNGDAGDDYLDGGIGNDTLAGGEGNDQLSDYDDSNTLDGGAGNDQFTVSSSVSTDINTLTGGTGVDTFNLIAWNQGRVIVTDFSAGVGGDVININDLLLESIGYASGNPFSNQLGYLRLLQSGADAHLQWDTDGLAGSNDWQTVLTLQNLELSKTPLTVDNFAPAAAPDGNSSGVNRIGDDGNNTLEGSVSDDTLNGLGGDDTLRGYAGNDLLEGGLGADNLYGGQGDDTLIAGTPDTLEDTGNNRLYGDDGKDTLIGSNNLARTDYLMGGNGDDNLSGGDGNDHLYGDDDYGGGALGNDTLSGGNGDDYLVGGDGDDFLKGDAGHDTLYGDAGNDSLVGGEDDDELFDYEGSNILDGGAGNDQFTVSSSVSTDINTLTGGTGVDTFNLIAWNQGRVIVTDFSAGVGGDVINIDDLLLESIGYASGNPFSNQLGYLRLLQSGADAHLQWDADGLADPNDWQTVLTLQNLDLGKTPLTANNFVPDVGLPTEFNHAPTAQDQIKGVATGTTYVLKASDFGFSDVDTADSLQAIKITSFPTGNFFFSLNGSGLTLNQAISVADLNQNGLVFTPNTVGAQYAIGFQVSDGSSYSVASYTLTLNTGSVNSLPVASNKVLSVNEDTALVLTAADFGFSDTDNGDSLQAITLTSLPSAGYFSLNGQAINLNQSISIADINQGLLVFIPVADANGGNYANIGFKVSDGRALSASEYNLTLNVAAGNDLPTASNKILAVNEDTALVLTASDFGFSDPDSGDSLQAITLTSLPAAGHFSLNGQAINLNQSISIADINQGLLVFTPVANANGGNYAHIGFKVSDGLALSASAYNLILNVAAVNDLPTASNKSLAVTEDTALVLAATDFGFSDADSGDSLQVITLTSLPAVGQLTLNGQVINLNQTVSVADINQGLLVFTPAANANGGNYANIGFKVSDGIGLSAAVYNLTLNVAAVNDLPTASNKTLTINEDTALVLSVADFAFNDPDGDLFHSVSFSQLPSAGRLSLNGTALSENQLVLAGDITAGQLIFTPDANANGDNYAGFDFKVSDGASLAAVASRLNVNVRAVNDAPISQDTTIVFSKHTPKTLALSDFAFTDLDTGNSLQAVMINRLPSTGSLSLVGAPVSLNQLIQAADITAGRLVFIPANNALGNDSFGFQVSDGAANSASYTVSLTTSAENPGVDNHAPQVFGFRNQYFASHSQFSFKLSETVFFDPDADHLSFTALQSNGISLPTGLNFDAATRTFTGSHLDAGDYRLKVTGSDGLMEAELGFSLVLNAPVTANAQGMFVGTDQGEFIVGSSVIKADKMQGGKGDDVYLLDHLADKVIEKAVGSGVDLVISRVNHTLAKNVENLMLDGEASAHLKGVGNALNNVMTGDDGNNSLDGGKGIDSYFGGKGDDTYYLDNLAETAISEFASEGYDTVILKTNTSGSYTLADYLETMTLMGNGVVNITGNAENNSLTGNAKANTLMGLAGNDKLLGGNGNDHLQGGEGDDLLIGGLGKDRLTGGAGKDQFVFDSKPGKANVDTISDFVSGVDVLKLDVNVFKSLAGDTALSGNFVVGEKALDSNDFLIYQEQSGRLYYDIDGAGAKAMVLIGVLDDGTGVHAGLTASDFWV